jgi:hypothetical protein
MSHLTIAAPAFERPSVSNPSDFGTDPFWAPFAATGNGLTLSRRTSLGALPVRI